MSQKRKLPSIESLKTIPERQIPVKIQTRREEWLTLFKAIPEGEALELTRDIIGVNPSTVKILISRMVKQGLLPPNYYTTQRTVKGKTIVYVVNSTKKTR